MGAGRSGIPHGRPHQPHHRPPPLDDLQRRPDVTLDAGRVDEIGTPAELAASGGIYAELLALQASSSKADRKRLERFGIKLLRTAPTMAPTQPRHERRIVPTRFGPGRSGVTGRGQVALMSKW